ncbi:hypothetical protein QCA50_017773 [Cerrena zonata]|uniref:HAMP domain-containing protein n=1 Tax=Cerrena zonata TaxID=2478898 RepID=A0AAW0FR38_9APHY
MTRRMYTAEEAYSSIKASERAGPDTKKHRSVGDSPPIYSPSSTSSAEFTNIVAPSDVSSQSPFFSPNNSSVDSLNSVYQEAKDRVDVNMADSETVESETTPSAPTQRAANGTSTPMTINLDGVPNPLDRTRLPNGNEHHLTCPHCGHGFTFNTSNSTTVELITGEPLSSPLVVPPSPLAATAYESGMSAAEELKLLKQQVQDVSRVCNAVARGDLSQKITVPVQGVVMVQLKEVINAMVDRLSQFAQEVTRVSQEVGTEGKLGGQAYVLDVEGTWRELTAVVNNLAANLTNQARSIARVTKAVAVGDLSQQIEVDARGEILELKETVNNLVVRLRALARVTLEVGQEGKLGSQVNVPDVEGVWLELTRNVNRMCLSLTDQVRSTANVTMTVAKFKGDFAQKIKIEVEGEMLTL